VDRLAELVRFAMRLCDVPAALIALTDGRRHWVERIAGIASQADWPVPPFCLPTMAGAELFVVPDASADRRFAGHPMVAGSPGVRFYAGMPLIGLDQRVFGALCVIDVKARTFSTERATALRTLARHAAKLAGSRFGETSPSEITARKEMEAALRESEARFQAFMRNNPAVAWIKDDFGRYVYVNDTLKSVYKLNADDVLGRTDAELLPPEVADRLTANDAMVLAAKKPAEPVEEIPVPDEGIRYWHVWKFPFQHAGKRLFVGGLAFDITERIETENALRHSEERYRSLVECARDSIFAIDPTGVITSLNDAFERITGWRREQWVGKEFTGLVAEEDLQHSMELFRKVLEGGSPPSFELQIRAPDGGTVPMEFTATPQTREGAVVGVLGIGRDIRERRFLEDQLRPVQKLDSIGMLAAGIAHDFNNILTVQQGCISLLMKGGGLPTETVEMLGQIADSADRAAALTRKLLLFSRKQVMQFGNAHLNEIVANLAKMLHRILGEDVELRLCCDEALPPVRADPGMLEQVLMNLAVNARDAMPEGGRLEISVEVVRIEEAEMRERPTARAGEFVCLRVADTGVGIPREVQEQIFEPFFTTKDVGEGTGLGLSTVHGIVKEHQGWIELESAPEAGSTFRVYLPVTQAAAEQEAADDSSPEAAAATAAIAAPGSFPRETILVVEDEKPLRCIIELLLDQLGYTVILAENGQDAQQVWEEHSAEIGLVITDIVMPGGVSGIDLAKTLRAKDPGQKVIFISGYSADLAGKELSFEGGTSFLQKPFSSEQLAKAVRDSLDG